MSTVAVSTSEAANSKTPPFVDASIQAYQCQEGQNAVFATEERMYPRNEALIETDHTAATPDGFCSSHHAFLTVGCHLGLQDFQGLSKSRDLMGTLNNCSSLDSSRACLASYKKHVNNELKLSTKEIRTNYAGRRGNKVSLVSFVVSRGSKRTMFMIAPGREVTFTVASAI